MCIGIPMQVVEVGLGRALCEADGEQRVIDTLLVGDQSPGTWLLTFLDSAREVLSPEAAGQIREALKAVELAMSGNDGIDDLFRDLVEREPELPEFLRTPTTRKPVGD